MIDPKQVLLILQKAQARITDPARWCQRAMARDAQGEPAEVLHGVSWCGIGAVYAELDESVEQQIVRAGVLACLHQASHARYQAPLAQVNDEQGHAAVLAVYADAIHLTEERLARLTLTTDPES